MKVLVIGGGGREHALIWKIAKSPKVKHIFCAPGNAGIADQATCVPIKANEINKLVDFVKEKQIDVIIPIAEPEIAFLIKTKEFWSIIRK